MVRRCAYGARPPPRPSARPCRAEGVDGSSCLRLVRRQQQGESAGGGSRDVPLCPQPGVPRGEELRAEAARRSGVAGYPGDGTQRWPAVHALDAAALFRLVLESAPAGTSWHAVGDEGDAVRDIATVIGRRLGLPVEAVPQENFGPFGPIFAMDQPASSAHTRDALGWRPTHSGLLEDLENIQP